MGDSHRQKIVRAEGFFENARNRPVQRRNFDFFRALAFFRFLPFGRAFAFDLRFGLDLFLDLEADFGLGFTLEAGFAGIDFAAAATAGAFGRAEASALVRKASERCQAMRAEFGS